MGKLLKKVLRGILRYQGQRRIPRQPVTPGVLLAISQILEAWLGEWDFPMIWAAFALAFYGFLRCSEFTYPGVHSFRPQFDLGTDCVSFHPSLVCPQHIVVTLKSSKTDFSCQGQSVAKSPRPRVSSIGYATVFPHCAPSQWPFVFVPVRSTVICLLQDAARCAIVFVSGPLQQQLLRAYQAGLSKCSGDGLLTVTNYTLEHHSKSCCLRHPIWLASQARIYWFKR